MQPTRSESGLGFPSSSSVSSFSQLECTESCRNQGSAVPWSLRHRCLSWLCQHCQKPDRHPSTEQWKSELIYLRKKNPKLVKRRGRHRLQALEALVRTTPRNQLYTTEREGQQRPCPPRPPALAEHPLHRNVPALSPFSLHHHENAAGRGGTGVEPPRDPPQLLTLLCSPKR